MSSLDELVLELLRSYQEAQERMADPAVYNDQREAADVGRKLKQLEEPVKSDVLGWKDGAKAPRRAAATCPSWTRGGRPRPATS